MTGDGPLRSASFVAHCSDCSERAVEVCFRCNRPWCAEHASFDDDLCRHCDEQWIERVRQVESRWDVAPLVEFAVAAAAPAIGIALAFVTGLGFLIAGAFAIVGFVLGMPLGALAARATTAALHPSATRALRRERELFLEGAARAALPAAELPTEPTD